MPYFLNDVKLKTVFLGIFSVWVKSLLKDGTCPLNIVLITF